MDDDLKRHIVRDCVPTPRSRAENKRAAAHAEIRQGEEEGRLWDELPLYLKIESLRLYDGSSKLINILHRLAQGERE